MGIRRKFSVMNTAPESGHTALRAASAAAKDWAVTAALPYWASEGVKNNGFCEEVGLDGKPNWDAVRRLRVQARQIYVYASASELGWFDGKILANKAMDFMLDVGFEKGGKPGFVHLLNPDLSVNDARRDLYDHAFYLLALSWHGRLYPGSNALELADRVIEFMDSELASKHGGWIEGIPADDARNALRRQNPHMHLFEAMMSLYTASHDKKYLRYAGHIYGLFCKHFYCADTVSITEFFRADWTPAKGDKSREIEPGHAAEWIWLLGWYEKLTGTDTRAIADALYVRLCRTRGIFANDLALRGGGLKTAPTRRLWVQTEMVKAHLAQYEYGDMDAASRAAKTLSAVQNAYLKPDGTWIDQLGPSGLPIMKPVPASTFYHILCMITEADRLANQEPQA